MVGRRGSSGAAAPGRGRSRPPAGRARGATGPAGRPPAGCVGASLLSCCEVLAQVTLLFMEPTAQRPSFPAGEPVAGRPQRVSALGGQRRRPSGEAPPLPRALNRSGRIWLVAAGGILLLWAGLISNQGTAVRVLELDHAVVAWFAGMRTGLGTDVMQTVHALGSRWTVRVLFWSTVAALVVLRRFRHLFVFWRGHPGRDRPHRPARLHLRLATPARGGDPWRLERLRQPLAAGGRAHRHPDGRRSTRWRRPGGCASSASR